MTTLKPALGQLRFRSLMLLETLVECGSLHAAAERLHVTQPALTSMLQEIERAFGETLFERSRKGVRPNAIGEMIVTRARLILNEVRNVESEVQSLKAAHNQLTLGIVPMMMLEIVPRALCEFSERNPRTRVHFREGNVPTLLKMLQEGTVDFIVGRFMFPPGVEDLAAELEHEPLFDEVLCVLASPRHYLVGKKRVQWGDIVNERWVLPPQNSATWQRFAQAFVAHGFVPPGAQYESSSFHSNVRIVHHTNCLMAAPTRVGECYESLGLVRRLSINFRDLGTPVSVIRRVNRVDRPVVEDFIAALRNQVSQ